MGAIKELKRLRYIYIFELMAILISVMYQMTGCGGGSGGGSSSAQVKNGVDPSSVKFYVNVTLKFPEKKDIKEIKEKSASYLDYFEVKLFKKDTETQIGDTQKVERPDTGNQATITFWDVPEGSIKLIIKGYSNNKVLFAEGESDIDVSLASATGNSSGGSGSGNLSNENTGNSVNNEPVVLPTGTVVNGPSAPKITEVKPETVSIGDTVTITGNGFGGSRDIKASSSKASDDYKSCIYFGGVKATDYVYWSDNYIVCWVPKNASLTYLNVSVSVGGGVGGSMVSAGSSTTIVSVQPAPSTGGGGGITSPFFDSTMLVEVPAITAANYTTVNLRLGGGAGAYASGTLIQRIDSFYIGKYEVTNTDFCTFLNSQGNQEEPAGTTWWNAAGNTTYNGIIDNGAGANPRYTSRSGFENRSAVYVSWYGFVAYCNWLTLQKGMTAGDQCYGGYAADGLTRWGVDGANYHPERKGYRLPTEAEWEYASRFKNTTTLTTMDYYWDELYNNPAGSPFNIAAYCWYVTNSLGNHHDVGGKTPNGLGLYDIYGNVWEWCSDWYNGTFPLDDFAGGNAVFNPKGTKTVSASRVLRGGCWAYAAGPCSSYNRDNTAPINRNPSFGLRLARTK